jgi:uncharacterized damage-inducible protein DinB
MDRQTLEELFDYDGWAWKRLIDALASLDASVITKPAPGSGWPVLSRCLAHMAFGYDAWLSRLEGEAPVRIDAAMTSLAELDANYERARGRFRAYFDALSDEDLQVDRDVDTLDGVLRFTPAEVLAHVVWHERAHHGDVSTLFYQLGLAEKMPMIDYRFYTAAKYEYS